MTRLFQEIAGSKTQNREFIEQAARQGFKLNAADFMRFARMAQGKDMGAIVQELRQSGEIDDQQYQRLESQAKGFLGLVGRFMGK